MVRSGSDADGGIRHITDDDDSLATSLAQVFNERGEDVIVTVGPSSSRFFTPRHGPPFRGTHVVLDDRAQLLYTTGSIPFYETYPGPYVPAPLGIVLDSAELAPQRHASELLALGVRVDGLLEAPVGEARDRGSPETGPARHLPAECPDRLN
jgi:hypothetical protein